MLRASNAKEVDDSRKGLWRSAQRVGLIILKSRVQSSPDPNSGEVGPENRGRNRRGHSQLVATNCHDRGSNTGLLDLQSNALPAELPRPAMGWRHEE